MSALKTLLEINSIKNGENANKILNRDSESSLFNSQQFILNIVLHASDVSTPTRKFATNLKWSKLLFEEFWEQGDTEK